MKSRKNKLFTVLLVAVALLASSCSSTMRETDQYKVTRGIGIYAHIHEKPTKQIIDLRSFCAQTNRVTKTSLAATQCTADLMRQFVKFEGWGVTQFRDALTHRVDDLRGELNTIQPTVDNGGQNNCLILHVSIANNLDWRNTTPGDDNCHVGKPFEIKT